MWPPLQLVGSLDFEVFFLVLDPGVNSPLKVCGCYGVPFSCFPTSIDVDLHNKARVAFANL